MKAKIAKSLDMPIKNILFPRITRVHPAEMPHKTKARN